MFADPRYSYYLKRGVGLVVGVFLGLILAGFVFESLMLAGDADRYPPPGKLYSIAGHDMHIFCKGESNGAPTVIIEAAAWASSANEATIQNRLSDITQVCTYDRAGNGWSAVTDSPRTPDQINSELRELLIAAAIPGPYILMGSGNGGIYVRNYAVNYPDEVVGVLLLDSRDEYSLSTARELPTWLFSLSGRLGMLRLFPEIVCPSFNHCDSTNKGLIAAFRGYSSALQTYDAETLALQTTPMPEDLQKKIGVPGVLGDIPLIILVSTQAKASSDLLAREEHWSQLSSATQYLTVDSGHWISLEQPDTVHTYVEQLLLEFVTAVNSEPVLSVTTVKEGLSNPWDLSFLNDTTFVYTQRGGELRGFSLTSGEDWLIVKPEDIYVAGEGGLLGLETDFNFQANKYIYTCMNVLGPSISVVRWKLTPDLKGIAERKDIITGLPSNVSGRHSGCRPAMAADGQLWVTTGDTANGTLPQDPTSLGGKVLRVDREGVGVAGNMSAPFDPRIFSYGHRNAQGIALFDHPIAGVYGFSSEHGSSRDDEVNLLKVGNFGWDPVPDYNESVEMTDLVKFPDAIPAIWSSGDPTIAVSGMTIVRGRRWQAWNGAVMLAVQKDMHVRLQRYDASYNLLREDQILNTFGRIRTVVQAPQEGDLFVLTDNGGGTDAILRVSPV